MFKATRLYLDWWRVSPVIIVSRQVICECHGRRRRRPVISPRCTLCDVALPWPAPREDHVTARARIPRCAYVDVLVVHAQVLAVGVRLQAERALVRRVVAGNKLQQVKWWTWKRTNDWMIVRGHNLALIRLYWASDNLAKIKDLVLNILYSNGKDCPTMRHTINYGQE
jgi:hypothetical protein